MGCLFVSAACFNLLANLGIATDESNSTTLPSHGGWEVRSVSSHRWVLHGRTLNFGVVSPRWIGEWFCKAQVVLVIGFACPERLCESWIIVVHSFHAILLYLCTGCAAQGSSSYIARSTRAVVKWPSGCFSFRCNKTVLTSCGSNKEGRCAMRLITCSFAVRLTVRALLLDWTLSMPDFLRSSETSDPCGKSVRKKWWFSKGLGSRTCQGWTCPCWCLEGVVRHGLSSMTASRLFTARFILPWADRCFESIPHSLGETWNIKLMADMDRGLVPTDASGSDRAPRGFNLGMVPFFLAVWVCTASLQQCGVGCC